MKYSENSGSFERAFKKASLEALPSVFVSNLFIRFSVYSSGVKTIGTYSAKIDREVLNTCKTSFSNNENIF